MKRAKIPKPTATETAMITRQSMQLDEEMAKNEKRLKAVARGGLGAKSLLGTAKQAAAKEAAAKEVKTASSVNQTMLSPSKLNVLGVRGYR